MAPILHGSDSVWLDSAWLDSAWLPILQIALIRVRYSVRRSSEARPRRLAEPV